MDKELTLSRFQPKDKVRYIGKHGRTGCDTDDGLFLEPGMPGQILRGPEARRFPLNTAEQAFYHVRFGKTEYWVRAADLENE